MDTFWYETDIVNCAKIDFMLLKFVIMKFENVLETEHGYSDQFIPVYENRPN